MSSETVVETPLETAAETAPHTEPADAPIDLVNTEETDTKKRQREQLDGEEPKAKRETAAVTVPVDQLAFLFMTTFFFNGLADQEEFSFERFFQAFSGLTEEQKASIKETVKLRYPNPKFN